MYNTFNIIGTPATASVASTFGQVGLVKLKTLTGSFPRQKVSPVSQPSDYTVQEAGKAQTDGLHGKKEHWGK